MSELRFDNRVAVITGAGGGLGRSHALLLASRGCKVVVNDLGGGVDGSGKSSSAADKVVEEIKAAGGTAVSNHDSVEDGDRIVKSALDAFGRIDIVINNAGILRDVSFQKMTDEDWDKVYRVHVLGAYRVTRAAWNVMRDAGFGRIIFTASAAGIYGNFGQANYSTAKLGLVGLSNTLALEGRKKNILVNAIAPIAGSRMTETILPKELLDALRPEYVSPLVAWLCHDSCTDTGGLYEVGGGFFARLRWQRSGGKIFKLGRTITPEQVQRAWSTVTGFEQPTYPTDVSSSMLPITTNVGTVSKGGNDLIDVDQALGYEFPEIKSSYSERDLALYALGVGAGSNPLDSQELRFVYESHPDGFEALPTYAVVPALNGMLKMGMEGKQAPGMNYGFDRILHGEQYTEVKLPLPTSATLRHKMRIKDIFDKGKNALVVLECRSFDETGEEVAYNEITSVVRGAGGWGGDRGPTGEPNVPPSRDPDVTFTEKVSESQALLYRLSGDINPLHVDPNFASAFGFPKPILHGLCVFGYVGRQVVKAFAKGDPRYFKSIKVRFAESVFPGETLVTEMWKESETRIIVRCKVKERDKPVITHAAVELYKEIPQRKPKAPAAVVTPSTSGSVAGPTSSQIFQGIGQYVAAHPELVSSVGTLFQFKLTGPDSSWIMDLKNPPGAVKPGTADKADCTLELSDEDWLGMATGKLNPQKLYFGGKLKITGNVMASQKLDFLKKIEPGSLKNSAEAKPAAEDKPAAPRQPQAPALFKALAERMAKDPKPAKDVGALLCFRVKDPDSSWVVDLKSSPPSVREGEAKDAAATFTLAEQDLLELVRGAPPKDLFQRGKLRVDGDVRLAHRLAFIQETR